MSVLESGSAQRSHSPNNSKVLGHVTEADSRSQCVSPLLDRIGHDLQRPAARPAHQVVVVGVTSGKPEAGFAVVTMKGCRPRRTRPALEPGCRQWRSPPADPEEPGKRRADHKALPR